MSALPDPPCYWPAHRTTDWRLPDDCPLTEAAGGPRWVCGVCHPPPFPEEFTVTDMGAVLGTYRIVRR